MTDGPQHYVDGVPSQDRVLLSRRDAAWLPDGGRADVVLAGAGAEPPSPTCLVRLLVTRAGRILTVPRADGRGLDLPTRPVGDGDVDGCVQTLMLEAVGRVHPTLLGWVRNVVPGDPDGYPWPLPKAHFAVWHCQVPADGDPRGTWLDGPEAQTHLGGRHWWPLAAHVSR